MSQLIAAMLLAITVAAAPAHTDNTYWLDRQAHAHEVATLAREYGLFEAAEECQQVWWEAEEELQKMETIIAYLIWYEAGSNSCSDRHQQLVGQVVMNRIRAENTWGNDIVAVLGAQGQYYKVDRTFRAFLNDEPPVGITQRCYDNAKEVIRGSVECPPNVVYQSEEVQGAIYEQHYSASGGTTTYFCYGRV